MTAPFPPEHLHSAVAILLCISPLRARIRLQWDTQMQRKKRASYGASNRMVFVERVAYYRRSVESTIYTKSIPPQSPTV